MTKNNIKKMTKNKEEDNKNKKFKDELVVLRGRFENDKEFGEFLSFLLKENILNLGLIL